MAGILDRPNAKGLAPRHVLMVVSGIILCLSASAMVFNVWSIFVVPVCDSLGVVSSQFTIIITIIFLACAGIAPIMGNLMEKYDLRIILSIAVSLCGIGVLLCAFWTEMWQFYISGIIEGAGVVAITYLSAPTLINRWFNVHMGLLVGICVAMMGVGGALWSMLGGVLIGDFGWRVTYEIFGLITLVLGLPVTIFIIRSYPKDVGLKPYGKPKDPIQIEEGNSWGVSAGRAFRSPAFWTLTLTIALFNGTAQSGNLFATYVHHLADVGAAGITPAIALMAASVVSACVQASQAGAKVLLGTVADRSILFALCLACGCGFLGTFLCWQGASNIWFVYIGAALFGFIYGSTNVLGPTITRYLFGSREYTKIYSRVTIFINISPAIMATMFAALSEIGWDFEFSVVLGIIATIFVLALITVRAGARMRKSMELEGARASDEAAALDHKA